MRRLALLCLMLMIAFSTLAAQAQMWRVATSDNFIVYSNGRESELIAATKRLETLSFVMNKVNARPEHVPYDNKLKVFLLPSKAKVQSYLTSESNVLGVYFRSNMGPMILSTRTDLFGGFVSAEDILQHEFGHHYMFHNMPAYFPAWFVEGFAEFFSTTDINTKGFADIGGSNPIRSLSIQVNGLMPSRKLFTQNPQTFTNKETEILYAQGWLILQYFANQPTLFKPLADYIERLNKGENNQSAFSAATGMTFEEFDQKLRTFYNNGRSMFRRLPLNDMPDHQVRVRSLSPVEQDFIDAEIYSHMFLSDEQAAKHLSAVQALAGKYPDDSYAALMLAHVELRFGSMEVAQKKIAAVLAKEPENARALLLNAFYYNEMLKKAAGAPSDALIKEARTWIVRANRANGNHPMPYVFYARLFKKGELPDAAFLGLVRAYELAPYLDEVCFMLASVFEHNKEYAAAIKVLSAIAANPHGGRGAAAAQSLIQKYREMQAQNPEKQQTSAQDPATAAAAIN
jgi:hypothetical protein